MTQNMRHEVIVRVGGVQGWSDKIQWLEHVLPGAWEYHGIVDAMDKTGLFKFKSESDAIMFALRWS